MVVLVNFLPARMLVLLIEHLVATAACRPTHLRATLPSRRVGSMR